MLLIWSRKTPTPLTNGRDTRDGENGSDSGKTCRKLHFVLVKTTRCYQKSRDSSSCFILNLSVATIGPNASSDPTGPDSTPSCQDIHRVVAIAHARLVDYGTHSPLPRESQPIPRCQARLEDEKAPSVWTKRVHAERTPSTEEGTNFARPGR